MVIDFSDRVRAQYEAYPYPHYPWWLPLRCQEAYASNSLFAARLAEIQGIIPAVRTTLNGQVLLAGCGDVYPYMAASWEPKSNQLIAVDLSHKSLKRAQLRCITSFRRIDWCQGSIEDESFSLPNNTVHIDSYGVLHHLGNPARVLERFAASLLPGGTVRIMVYNRESRTWIHQLQSAFSNLGLSPLNVHDLEHARTFLNRLSELSPALGSRLASMQIDTLPNASRLIDTFFHAREARLGLTYWLKAIENAGLKAIGLIDRYGELDDLPNPLWEFPNQEALQLRIGDRRFENNLEIYLAKPPQTIIPTKNAYSSDLMPNYTVKFPKWHALHSPPKLWFDFDETRSISIKIRFQLWWNFLRTLRTDKQNSNNKNKKSSHSNSPPMDSLLELLAPEAIQRLARLGAIFPEVVLQEKWEALMKAPRHPQMEPLDTPSTINLFSHRELRSEIETLLRDKNLPTQRLEFVMRRLDAAQRP